MKIGSSWSSLRRDVSNSWNSNGLSYNAPFHLRLTSVLGDVVEDYIPSNSGGQGSSQFPEITPDPAAAKAGVEALTPEYPGLDCTHSVCCVCITTWACFQKACMNGNTEVAFYVCIAGLTHIHVLDLHM